MQGRVNRSFTSAAGPCSFAPDCRQPAANTVISVTLRAERGEKGRTKAFFSPLPARLARGGEGSGVEGLSGVQTG
jgi:hypothetical protein